MDITQYPAGAIITATTSSAKLRAELDRIGGPLGSGLICYLLPPGAYPREGDELAGLPLRQFLVWAPPDRAELGAFHPADNSRFDAAHSLVALIAGRKWRTPPAHRKAGRILAGDFLHCSRAALLRNLALLCQSNDPGPAQLLLLKPESRQQLLFCRPE